MLNNEASAAVVTTVISPVSAANTAGATSGWIDMGAVPQEGYAMFVLNVGAVTGSMTALLQDAVDGSGTGAATINNGTFPALAANTSYKLVIARTGFRRYVKFIGTVVTGPVLLGVTAFCRQKSI